MKSYEEVLELIRGKPGTWLVTGTAGFIGSHLAEALLNLDQNVVGLDNFMTGKRENLTAVLDKAGPKRRKNFNFIEGDIRSFQTCRNACRGVDRVLHQAAIGSVPRSIDDPLETNGTNIDGFVNILTAARDAGAARFVYAASSSTYGDTKRLPFVESEIGKPLSPYALSKYIDELYADLYARCYGTQAIGLRYFNVFGPRQDPDGQYAAVIPKWIAALLADEPVYINGDGTTARDFCYIQNVVQANLLAAMVEDAAAVNQVYNVACGARTTLDELYQLIRVLLAPNFPAVMGRKPIYRDFRRGDMHLSQADIGKAQALLGYRPAWDIREGLKWALDWYVANLSPSARPAAAPTAAASPDETKTGVLS